MFQKVAAFGFEIQPQKSSGNKEVKISIEKDPCILSED